MILDKAFTLPVKSGLEPTEVTDLAASIQEKLSARIRASLFGQPASVEECLRVTNDRTGREKRFIKVVSLTDAGTSINYFIRYQSFGIFITAHYMARTRGRTDDLSLVKFITLCPFSIWLWGVPWLFNRYSIMAELSGAYGDSFDEIDLITIFHSLNHDIIDQTIALLDEDGLLSESLKTTLTNIQQNVVA